MSTPGTIPTVQPALQPSERRTGRGRGIVPLGRVAGIPLGAHWTSLFTLALFAEILATSILPAARPGHATSAYWLTGIVTAAVFLASLLVHELAHAVIARRQGVGVKGITLWMLGGVTELDGDAPSPRAEGLIAGSGPAASLVVGALSLVLGQFVVGSNGLVGSALVWLGVVSMLLAVFNLLPGAPLDGGRVLRAAVWARTGDRARAERAAGRSGRAVGFGLIGLGVLEFASGTPAGLWLALIGWFVVTSATAEQRHAGLAELAGLQAADAMTPVTGVVPEWWTIEQFLASPDGAREDQAVLTLVDFGGAASGTLTMRDVVRVPVALRDEMRLRDIVRARRGVLPFVTPETPLPAVVATMRVGNGVVVVVDDTRRPIGTITSSDLAAVLRARAGGAAGSGTTPVSAR